MNKQNNYARVCVAIPKRKTTSFHIAKWISQNSNISYSALDRKLFHKYEKFSLYSLRNIHFVISKHFRTTSEIYLFLVPFGASLFQQSGHRSLHQDLIKNSDE